MTSRKVLWRENTLPCVFDALVKDLVVIMALPLVLEQILDRQLGSVGSQRLADPLSHGDELIPNLRVDDVREFLANRRKVALLHGFFGFFPSPPCIPPICFRYIYIIIYIIYIYIIYIYFTILYKTRVQQLYC